MVDKSHQPHGFTISQIATLLTILFLIGGCLWYGITTTINEAILRQEVKNLVDQRDILRGQIASCQLSSSSVLLQSRLPEAYLREDGNLLTPFGSIIEGEIDEPIEPIIQPRDEP